jgi:hypothetical protein
VVAVPAGVTSCRNGHRHSFTVNYSTMYLQRGRGNELFGGLVRIRKSITKPDLEITVWYVPLGTVCPADLWSGSANSIKPYVENNVALESVCPAD